MTGTHWCEPEWKEQRAWKRRLTCGLPAPRAPRPSVPSATARWPCPGKPRCSCPHWPRPQRRRPGLGAGPRPSAATQDGQRVLQVGSPAIQLLWLQLQGETACQTTVPRQHGSQPPARPARTSGRRLRVSKSCSCSALGSGPDASRTTSPSPGQPLPLVSVMELPLAEGSVPGTQKLAKEGHVRRRLSAPTYLLIPKRCPSCLAGSP